MNDKTENNIHWSFWVISVFAVVWNALGGMNFLTQMNADMVATFPDTHRAIIIGRPIWATAGFAIGVFIGALGGVMLLLRKSAASYLFVASLVGILVTMIHTIRIASSTINFSPMEIFLMILLPLVVAAFLLWYSRQVENKGWIR